MFVVRYLLYVTTSLLSALILSSCCLTIVAHFSANSIYLGSRNRSSKFKCWCFSLIQAKWSFGEKHKIGKPLFNGRWLIGADSLRAITMTTSEASTLLQSVMRQWLFPSSRGQKWSQSKIVFWLLFWLGVVWKDKVWYLRAASVVME